MKFEGPKNAKQKRIVGAFMHAWNAYKKYAWGYDELFPLSKIGHQWMGVGMTIVDSIDTMYIMGLEKEFELSRDWVRDKLSSSQHYPMQFFEVVIRLLGGLLSAYHLSGDHVFLDKAKEFGTAFRPCLKSSTHFPCSKIITSQKDAVFSQTNLAEIGSIQLEFRDLSRLIGDPYYEDKTFATNLKLKKTKTKLDGLIPYNFQPDYSPEGNGPISVGAMADSYYEYLLKQWLQTGKTRDWLKEHFIEAHRGVLKHLIKKSVQSNLTYIGFIPMMGDSSQQMFEHKMEHLSCFYPGLLALAHIHGIINVRDADQKTNVDLIKTAAELTETCYEMYHQMPTGLSPESVLFDSHEDFPTEAFMRNTSKNDKPKFSVDPSQKYNIHRPETVESLFYMYKATKDEKYREWAWLIFEAFENSTRLSEGYAGVKNVGATSPNELFYMDKMETFYLAETLKYLYLMFEDGPDPLPLDQWVYNTEAHPLPVYAY